ncbi:MAG: hypothetical protein J7M08_09735 [Planctomycetes bacterium]|nr:hypothetical protein [Planctomycetota bacterium]
MAFENIYSQPQVTRALRALLGSGRLPQALLLVGAEGLGRLGAARELARVVLCTDSPSPADYCGRCRSCRMSRLQDHPDYLEFGVPEGKQQVPISAIRQIADVANLTPVLSTHRVFVVREAERMSLEAANCFLKTLEEPPGDSLLVLIASSARKLPETIVSRCQQIRFAGIAPRQIAEGLEEAGASADEAWWLARRSWGSPGLAERFRELELHEFNREFLPRLRSLSIRDNFKLSDFVRQNAKSRSGSAAEMRERLQDLLESAALYCRDLALAATQGEMSEHNFFNSHQADELRRDAAGRPARFFIEQAQLLLEAAERIGANANQQLTLDHTFTQLAKRMKTSA